MELITLKDCRNVYREILQGYSYVECEGIYVKHFRESDLGFIDYIYKRCENDLSQRGVFTSAEKLSLLDKEGYWTEDDENGYYQVLASVKDAYEFQRRLQNVEQRKMFQKTIDEQEEKLKKIQEERYKLVEPTVESYCNKKINEEYVRKALYKDEKLEKPLHTQEEFDNISYADLSILVKLYNDSMNKFNEDNIKKVCVNNFFLNSFMMADNDPVKFFGTSVLELTIYQLNLFSRGKYYKFILEEGNNPPDSVSEMAEKEGVDHLVKYYDLEYNRIKMERERKISQMKAQNNKGRR
ncbi:hypothetical protein CMI37_16670 [Candidatus Pacearchaeota archaeon]|nr:hypothetical protein [Candidatus Pacearchaeota archaeon]